MTIDTILTTLTFQNKIELGVYFITMIISLN